MQRSSGEVVRGGKIALLDKSVQLEAFDVDRPVAPDLGRQRADVTVGGAADLHGQFLAQRAGFGRLGNPSVEFVSSGNADRVDLLVRTAFLNDRGADDPSRRVHSRQDSIDLLVCGAPEEADGLVESAREFVPRAGQFGEGDEYRVFECHANQYVCNGLTMQQSA